MSSDRVSVVVISWNTRELTLRCLRSVLPELESGDELVVIDNASTDGTVGAIRKELPNVIIKKNKENTGFARAANQAFSIASNELVWLLNSDIEVMPGCLSILRYCASSNAGWAVISPANHGIGFAGNMTPLCMTRILARFIPFGPVARLFWWLGRDRGHPNQPFTHPYMVRYVPAFASFYRKTEVQDIGAMDEGFIHYFEDVDLCERFVKAGRGILVVPAAIVKHQNGASSYSIAWWSWQAYMLSGIRYTRKHFGRLYGSFVKTMLGFCVLGTLAKSLVRGRWHSPYLYGHASADNIGLREWSRALWTVWVSEQPPARPISPGNLRQDEGLASRA